MGRFYERLVGIKKKALRKTLWNHCLTEKQLATVVVKVKAVVNTYLLVYVYDDINSSAMITPSHFLLLHYQNIIPNIVGDFKSNPNYETEKPTNF